MFHPILRRALRPLYLFALLCFALASCAPATGAANTPPTSAAPIEFAAYPVTIEHKYGSTTIDKFPERIVLVGLTEQDAMLALGVVPVATSEWYGKRPGAIFEWAKDKLGAATVPVVLDSVNINFEQIATLKPDLIVGLYAGLTQDVYDTLSKIAPTVAQPKEYVDYGIPWQELTRKIGLIVGKSAEAEALIAQVDADFAKARAAHPEFEGKTGVVSSTWGFADGNYYAYHSQDPRNRFMTSLGFTVPAEIDKLAGKEYGATISLERLDIVDTDALVWITLGEKEVGEQRNMPIYSKIRAAKEGRDIFLTEADPLYDALNFNTVLSIPFALEKLVPRLVAAVDGDPTTVVKDETSAAIDAFPVTIENKFGSTVIPAEPKRVISVGYSEQDPLLALGVTPIAVRYWFGDQRYGIWPWVQDELGDAKPELLNMGFGEINFETLAALQPDLIVATQSGITEDEYKKLTQIAPTLAQPAEYADFAVPWQDQTLLIGKALGRSQKAEALIAEVEAKLAAAAAAHPEFAKSTIAWLTPTESASEYWVTGPNAAQVRSLLALGFQYPDDVATFVADAYSVKLSTERLDLVDTGVLILGQNSTQAKSREEVLADPLFQKLKAYKEGRMIFFGNNDPLYGALSFSTVASLSYVVDNLVPQLAAAVDGDPATTAEAAPAADAFPVTIENKFGSTVIPAEPKRVIALGYSEQDPILALGVTPIAVRDWFGGQPYGVWPWVQDELGDAKPELIKMEFGALNFETLATLKPDLIVATHSGITEDEYEKLAQIAPTLAQPGKYDDFATPWQEQTRLIGQALGRSERAEALIAEVEAKIKAAAVAHPEFAKSTIAWLTPTESASEYWVVGPNTPPLRFLAGLGFQYPKDVATLVGTASSGKLSTERLDMIDTSVLILRAETTAARDAILADPLFQKLKATKEGRIIFFVGNDPVYGSLSFSTVASLSYAVDKLVPQLAAAVDGDSATK